MQLMIILLWQFQNLKILNAFQMQNFTSCIINVKDINEKQIKAVEILNPSYKLYLFSIVLIEGKHLRN